MKTSFLSKGKFKLVLFLTLCTVVLGCALFAFIGIYTYTQTQKNITTGTESSSEIVAPENEGTATAATRIAMPTISDLGQAAGSTFYKGDDYSLSSDGRTATISYAKYFPGFAPFLISVSNYNTTYMTCVVTSDVTDSDGGGSSWLSFMSSYATYTLKSGYAWSNGTTSPITLSLDVTPIDMSEMEITGIDSNYTYTGSPITPSPTVRYKYRDESMLDGYDYEELSEGTDYTVSYSNNVNEGTATVTITGINEYYGGTVTCNYTIRRISVAMPIFTGIDDEYNGFSEDDIKSVEGDFYTLSSNKRQISMSFDIFVKFNSYSTLPPLKAYISNYNASYMTSSISSTGDINGADKSTYIQLFGIGTTTITYTLKTGYKWSDGSLNPITLTLTVDPIDISDVDISGINTNYTYTGSPIVPAPSLRYNYNDYYSGTLQNPYEDYYDLTEGADYRYYYSNNTNEGTATVTIEGIGEYGGTVTQNFTIRRISTAMPVFTGINGAGGWTEEDLSHDGAFYTLSSNKRNISMNYDMFVKFNGYSNVPPFQANISNYSSNCMTYSASGTGANSDTNHGGADYLWSFGVGTVSVTYTLKTGYRWSDGSLDPITLTFTVDPIDISDVDISGINANYTYTGSPITPTPSLRYNYIDYNHHGDVNNPYEDYYDLTKDTDYTLTYKNNTDVGTGTVTITGIGDYDGTITRNFTIAAKSISGATIADIANQTYTGNEIKPTPTVTLTGYTPTYSVTYSNNVNVGTATITVTGTGNFNGTATKTFIIDKAEIPSLGLSYSTVTYGTDSAAPTVTGNVGNGTLSYTVANGTGTATINAQTGVITPTQAGDITVTLSVAASANYNAGSKTITVTIEKATLSLGLSYPTVTYGTDSAAPTVTGNLGGGKLSFTLQNPAGGASRIDSATGVITPSQAGTVEVGVMVDATTNYTAGSKTITVTIAPRDISNASFGAIGAINYDGFKKEPTPEITDNAINKTLTDGTDFTFSYLNNIDAGSATITITGKGNYTGTKSTSFTINGRNVEDATVGTLDSYIYDGTEKKPTATVTFGSTTLISGTDFEFSYSSNINAGKGKLIITGKGNYSGTKEVEFTISARNLSNATIADLPSQEYNGVPKTPALTLTDLGKTLVLDTDYTVSYKDNTNAGTATVTITGTGNYTGERTRTFSITARSISNAVVATIPDEEYDGTAKEPTVTATDLSKTLTQGADYELSYADNVNAGQASVTLTGKGNYTGTKTVYFTIDNAGLSSATVTLGANTVVYDGTAHEPTVTVRIGSDLLVNGTDYTVAYKDNTTVGTATVTITGKGDYRGTKTATFEITAADISGATVTGVNASYTYTGSAIEPAVTVTLDGKTLVKNSDYTVSYKDNTGVGTATVTITGTGNYGDKKEITFTIAEADVSAATVTGVDESYTYTGSAIEPTVTVTLGSTTLAKDTDYTVSYSANTALGTATVTVTGTGNYTGTKTVNFEIVAATLTGATIGGLDASYTYTGTAIAPAITVTLDGATLVKDTDYTVEYTDNTELGTATVTITGCGNYTGVKTVTFEIVAADVENATVTGVDVSYGYTGTAIAPTITVTLSGVTLVKDTDYTVSYTNNTALGTATVTVTGKGNYTGVKTITFEITAADIAKATLSGIDKNYPYTGSAITPDPQLVLNGKTLVKDADFTVTYRNNIDLGAAVVEINGIGNYTGTKSTAFTVIKANIGTARVDSVNPEYEHTGAAIEPLPVVTLNGVTLVKDRDYTVEYENNVEIGTATYAITGIGNYEGSITGSFKITIALPEVEVNFVSYNGTDKLFAGKALPEITATATYNGATVEGTLSWDLKDPILEEGTHDYYWTFTPADADNFAVVTGYKTLTAEKPNYIAIRAEWKGVTQPELFTSSTIAFLKQNLKITGIFSSGDVEEIVGGYALVGSWDSPEATNTVKMPVNGGDDFTVTVNFGAWSDTIVSVVIQDVILKEITVDPAEGKEIKTEYTALDGFDVSSVAVTAKYNDGSEKVLPSGNNGYSVVYEKGADSLQYGDTKVTFSFTDNGITKTVEINGLTISKKPLDKPLVFTPEDTDYNYGNPVTDGIELKDLPDWINVTYVYEDEGGNILDPSAVKNAGKYKVTAKFTVDKNHEDIDDITATFEIKKLNPVLNPSVGGSLSVGKSLSELTVVAGGEAPAGKLTWDNSAYQLQEGVNKCYYTFTPDDTVNFNVVHGFVEVTASGEIAPVVNGAGLGGWQIALIIICFVVVTIALIALTVALKSRRAAADSDGFYDDASPEDMN